MAERSAGMVAKPAPAAHGALLQRKCACGTHTPGGGQCAACGKRNPAASSSQGGHLAVGQAGDRFEREADRVAALVMSGRDGTRPPSFSVVSGASVQRDGDGQPKTPKPNNYDEAAKKIADALQATEVGKQLKAKAEALGEEFLSSVEGKVIAGSALGGALAAIIATNSELPMQIPDIPLDFIKPGLKARLTWEGPVRDPTKVGLTLTSKSGASLSASYSQTAATPGKPAEQKAGLTLTVPLGGSPAKTGSKGADSEKYRTETARMAAEQRKFQEGLKTTAQKAQDKADEQRFLDSWMRSRTNDPLDPLRTGKKDDDLLLMRKASGHSFDAGIAPPIVHETLAGSGSPLDPDTRAFMEDRFVHDFSRVRIHADARAAESARDVGAHAYTVGPNIAFDTGQYAPLTHTGRHLLAHELAHVVQQGQAPIFAVQRACRTVAPDAHAMARDFTQRPGSALRETRNDRTDDDTLESANDGPRGGGTPPLPGARPSGTRIDTVTNYTQAALQAGYLSGLGIVAHMQVLPDSTTWDGNEVVEAVQQTSSTCPDTLTVPGPCHGHSHFPIGASMRGRGVRPEQPAMRNRFHDIHTSQSEGVSFLHEPTRNPLNLDSCESVCRQDYRYNGAIIGSHSIRRVFRKGTFNGHDVTIVDVTKSDLAAPAAGGSGAGHGSGTGSAPAGHGRTGTPTPRGGGVQ